MVSEKIDSRWAINGYIGILALFVFVLSGITAWHTYREWADAAQLARVNKFADRIIQAAGIQALERGFVASGLGGAGRPRAMLPGSRQQLREQGDAIWDEAMAIAREIIARRPGDQAFIHAFQRTQRDYQVLVDARARVDASLDLGKPVIASAEWIGAMTRFIHSAARLREAGFISLDSAREVVQMNITIKHQAWLMSEYAGIERGTLAFFIAAGQPVPAGILDSLKSYRGVVMHAARVFQEIKTIPHTDPRVIRAVEKMEENFLGRYNGLRDRVYAAGSDGRYPVTGEGWMLAATDAINSIIDVVAATSLIIDEKAGLHAERSIWMLVASATLLGMSLLVTVLGFARTIKTSNALFHEKELAEVTLHSIGDAVITTDAAAKVEYLNPIAEDLTGWSMAEARGRPLGEVFNIVNGITHQPQPNPVEECLREQHVVGLESNTLLIRRDGTRILVEDSAAPVRDRDNRVVGAVLVFYDATKSRNMPHLLSYQATHDALTGLVNRREFERRLGELLLTAKTAGKKHALCYLDLDMFKIVNDTCGHVAGDKLLRLLSQMLGHRLRDNDMLARLGGDEFGVLLESCPLDVAERIANDLRRIVKDFRFSWQGRTFEGGASIGLVAITPDSVSPEELLSEADAACYAAKDKGRNRVQVHTPGDNELARRHSEMKWVSVLTKALEENRFVLYQQAIASLGSREQRAPCCEILLRLRDEAGEIVEPGRFIPAAERYNLMPAIDRWVVRSALRMIGECLGAGSSGQSRIYTINLSGASLCDEHFLEFVQEQFGLHHVDPGAICFEITETAIVANLEQAVNFINALRQTGCRFALDDFGMGMSSFAYLKSLPVDYLKIAGTFVLNMVDDAVDCAMVDTINRIGHVMGIRTIAEFVENDAIRVRLQELGVDYAQGYSIARPAPLDEQSIRTV